MESESSSKKITRREFVRIAAGVAGAAVLASCAPAQPTVAPNPPPAAPTVPPVVKGKVEITWWRSLTGLNGDTLDAMVKKFNESQNRVTVKSEYQGEYAALRDKLTAAVAAGGAALPDCAMLADVQFLPFARNKNLEPLDDFAKGSNGVNLSDFYPVVDRGRVNNVLYQLPLGVSTPVFYYNEDALKKAGLDGPPKTWDQFFDTYVPKATVKEGGKTTMYGFAFLANADWWWQQSVIWSYGGDLVDANWNTLLDSQQVLDFLTRFQKLFKEGQAYLPTAADGSAVAYFGSGRGAMMIESTGVIGRLDDTIKGAFKAGVAYLPEGPAGRKVPTGGCGISILAGVAPEKKQAAWEFIRWLEQPEQVAQFDGVAGYLPHTQAAATAMTDLFNKDPRRKVASEQLAWSRGQSPLQGITRAADVYFDAMLQVLNSGVDPKVLMPQVQKKVQAIVVEEGLKK